VFKRFCDKKVWGFVAVAAGAGILSALILPFWILVILLAALLIVLGLCYI